MGRYVFVIREGSPLTLFSNALEDLGIPCDNRLHTYLYIISLSRLWLGAPDCSCITPSSSRHLASNVVIRA